MDYIYSVHEMNQLISDLTEELTHTAPRAKELSGVFIRYAERFGYEPLVSMSFEDMMNDNPGLIEYSVERDDC